MCIEREDGPFLVCGGSEKSHCVGGVRSYCLSTLSTDTAGQLDILGHDGHTLGVDGAQVGVLEESNQVCLGSFLESLDG